MENCGEFPLGARVDISQCVAYTVSVISPNKTACQSEVLACANPMHSHS